MMRIREEGSKGMKNFTLPEDLIAEILLRLPVKSLVRFKCVCKSWLSLISDPQFAKSHFDLAATPTHRVLTTSINDSEIMSLTFVPLKSCIVDVPLLPSNGRLQIAGYCRGIMLLTNNLGDFVVWNPSTGTYRKIPVSCFELDPTIQNCNSRAAFMHYIIHGFGYDKSTDDYLLVLIRESSSPWYRACNFSENSHPRIQVFSLKTNVPSFIYGVDVEYDVYSFDHAGLFLNQSLHWLVRSKVTQLPLVLAFDLIDRSLSEIPLSLDCLDLEVYGKKRCDLIILGGCLSLYYYGSGGGGDADEIWVMKEYKVPTSWIKSFVLSRYIVLSRNISYGYNRLWPICLTKGGALLAWNGDGTIMKLNDNGEVLEHHTYEFQNHKFPKHLHMYRESLLPLP